MKNYYKINEIAKLYHIGLDSLRYYEKIGLIEPTRDSNNYRQYSLSDIWKLNVIRDLLSLDFSTAEIADYLSHRSIGTTIELLDKEDVIIQKKIDALEKAKLDVEKRRSDILLAKQLPTNIPRLQYFPERKCLLLKDKIERNEDIDYLITKLSSSLEENLSIIGNTDTGAMIRVSGHSLAYSSVFIMDNTLKDYDFLLPAADYLTLTYRGNYDKNYEHIRMMQKLIAEKGWTTQGPFLEFLLIDIHETRNKEEYITQLQIQIE